MSNPGDVVFCLDCDRNIEAYRSAGGAESSGLNEPPRRMGVKKDANGDRLCQLCLDLRRAKRNAAFLLRAGRAQLPEQQPTSTTGLLAEPPTRPVVVRVASAVRITRPAIGQRAAKPESPPQAETVRSRTARGKAKEPHANGKQRSLQASPMPRAVAASLAKEVAASLAKQTVVVAVAPKPEPKAKGHSRERAFLTLTAEIGFLRARFLLDQLTKKVLGVDSRG
jgi:hypothetical protein